MESLDMDDETSATFEHLFVEEFDANDHKTQHIRRVSASPKNKFSDIVVKKKTNENKEGDESGDIEWNLSKALEQKDSAVESSLDLFERDEVDNNTDVSNSNEMPSQFTGVFLPVNSARRANTKIKPCNMAKCSPSFVRARESSIRTTHRKNAATKVGCRTVLSLLNNKKFACLGISTKRCCWGCNMDDARRKRPG